MSPHERMAAVTSRIAIIPAVLRTRREDAVRAARTVEGFDARVEAAVVKLEKAAQDLEKAIA